jgi:hypothetical protein
VNETPHTGLALIGQAQAGPAEHEAVTTAYRHRGDGSVFGQKRW